MTEHQIRDMLAELARVESHLDLLLTRCNELGGFCSYYVHRCYDELHLMKNILLIQLQLYEECDED